MPTYAIADIHGNYFGLGMVLHKCGFNKEHDTLINLGDVCDGGCCTKQVIDELLTIKNHILCMGNHDNPWALDWMREGIEHPAWWHQGGMRTAESYSMNYKNVPESHIKFLESALPFYRDSENRVFVHGGFSPSIPIEKQVPYDLTWDRALLCEYAPKHIIKGYKHVFVGHTSTQFFGRDLAIKNCLEPLTFNNLTALDTGGGWDGRLTIMDIDTFKFWQTDINANTQNEIFGMKNEWSYFHKY